MLVSLRLSNIYDLNSKILLLKFAKPDCRRQLLIESGFRCHLTDFARTAAPAPSAFVARLRKFLKTRRVTRISQIGTDRIIEFQFSDGAYRLYLEFFASGNVILTDADLKILALLRNVPEGEGQEPQRVGLTYRLDNRQNYGGVPALTRERLRTALQTAVEQAVKKPSKKKAADELRRGLATTITELPPVLVDHVFQLNKFDSTVKPLEVLKNEDLFESLFKALEQGRAILDEITSSPVLKGYIIAKPNPHAQEQASEGGEAPNGKASSLLYEDFQPFLPKQFEEDPNLEVLTFDGFNKTVDEFFSSLEGQKLQSRLQEREATAKKKLEAARQDQAKRIEGLQEAQILNLRKAAAIEANIERVQEAMDAVNGLLQQGMDWVDINKLVEREQKLHNPVAEIIKLPMRLHENIITLLLGEEEEEGPEDEEMDFEYDTDEEAANDPQPEKAKGPDKRLAVDINLKLSPWNNAREYYEQKRSAADKAQKTIQQAEIALKNAEMKIAKDLKKDLKQEKPILQPIRQQLWFEKFIWFISSDGYLVLGGRDAQQNEILYKRYFKKGDVFVHSDVKGAATVIIKNDPKTPDAPIPPATLTQAGCLSVCCSSAWDSKAAMGAWWVTADKVSKLGPTGDPMPEGTFMINGERNPLEPPKLLLGFGLLFKVSEESKVKHVKHSLYGVDDRAESTTEAPLKMSTDKEDGTKETGEAAEEVKTGSQEEQVSQDVLPEKEESSDEDEDDADQKRSNPLQSMKTKTEPTEMQQDPPSEELSRLQVSDDQFSSEEQPQAAPEGDVEARDSQQPKQDSSSPERQREEEKEKDEDDANQEEQDPTQSSTGVVTPSSTKPQQHPPKPKQGPPKRGQRGKAKKTAAKYRHQDEEDRALMEELLGVAAAKAKREAEAAAKAKREAELAAALERKKAAQERARRQIAEHEARRQKILRENIDNEDDGADAVMDLRVLESLVGIPLPGDEILEVVPVCAPWQALSKVKYKAKIQPGMAKKGKAVKDIVERWRTAAGKKGVVDEKAQDPERMWPREVELIRGMRVEEAFNVVPVSKVAIELSGGLAAAGGSGGSKGGGKAGSGGGGGQKGGKGGKGGKR